MQIVIFGATGSVGSVTVRRAVEQGHRVTAFTRDKSRITNEGGEIQAVQGDVFDPVAVEKAVRGQDVVICMLGAGRKGRLRSVGTRNIVVAMQLAGVKRLICLSSLGVGESRRNLNFFWKHLMFGMLLREAYRDHIFQEEIVRESGLDWTIVRPAAFTDDPPTGSYRHGFGHDAKGLLLKVSRADVADFVLKQLSDTKYIHMAPGLSY